MRAPTGVVQDSPVVGYKEGKDYASKVNFNCMATSGAAPCPIGRRPAPRKGIVCAAVRPLWRGGYSCLLQHCGY